MVTWTFRILYKIIKDVITLYLSLCDWEKYAISLQNLIKFRIVTKTSITTQIMLKKFLPSFLPISGGNGEMNWWWLELMGLMWYLMWDMMGRSWWLRDLTTKYFFVSHLNGNMKPNEILSSVTSRFDGSDLWLNVGFIHNKRMLDILIFKYSH